MLQDVQVHDNYYTDCTSCKEFIDEIYCVVLTPSRKTGRCQMENFRGESTLACWLRTACLFYCYYQFKAKGQFVFLTPTDDEENETPPDRYSGIYGSVDMDINSIHQEDIRVLLDLMPNPRYREIIRLRYLEQKTNEETAQTLELKMDVYYNSHLRAKKQLMNIYKKEMQHE